jgi:hypothetical protein
MRVRVLSFAVLLLASAMVSHPAVAATPEVVRADARGFVDVWALRRDVARVEALHVSEDGDRCADDSEERVSPAEQRRRDRAARLCSAEWQRARARFDDARRSLKRAWAPVLLEAIRKGDQVAEVIWRQCDTTSVLERSALESTCDEVPQRRAVAARRLREIGFVPVVDRRDEVLPPRADPTRQAHVRAATLHRFAAGDLGAWTIDLHLGGNVASSESVLEAFRDAMVLDTALVEARRAFTFTTGKGVRTDELAGLRLNRSAATPGVLVWQANVIGGSGEPYTGRHDWRAGSETIYLKYGHKPSEEVGGADDARVMRRVQQMLSDIEVTIERWLAEDPRWGVFVIERVGRHEWVPMNSSTESGRLDAAWQGAWALERQFDDWRAEQVPSRRARIVTRADRSWVQFDGERAGDPGTTCELRYSGGSSYGQAESGHLPWFTRDPGRQRDPTGPLLPLDVRKAYRQVLVQCAEGEHFDNRKARLMFLAEDTIVEITKPADRLPYIVRHWQRSADAADAPSVPMPSSHQPTPADVIRMFDEVATSAEAAEGRRAQSSEHLAQATTGELIAMLATSRNESLYYNRNAWPENVQVLRRRDGAYRELCHGYLAMPSDPMVRFNLVMLLVRHVKEERVPHDADAAEEATACLRAALRDPHPWVRTEAVWGIAYAGSVEDVQYVEPLLQDHEGSVSMEARNAVETLRRVPSKKR